MSIIPELTHKATIQWLLHWDRYNSKRNSELSFELNALYYHCYKAKGSCVEIVIDSRSIGFVGLQSDGAPHGSS